MATKAGPMRYLVINSSAHVDSDIMASKLPLSLGCTIGLGAIISSATCINYYILDEVKIPTKDPTFKDIKSMGACFAV